jgi:ABC-type multidrug transport system permease subunit
MLLLFPAIILLSVIMQGLTQATRLTRWREQRILQRLALTPVPLPNLIIGAALTQIVVGVLQGALMLVFGILVVGLTLTWQGALLVLWAMVLASACFIAFGSLISTLSHRADLAGYVFFFSVTPLTFLASFPSEMLPDALDAITPWLPTSMAIELVGPQFLSTGPARVALDAVAGLVAYTLVALTLTAIRLRREA